jgi:uncharacterized MAPEG superfamily protein
VAPLLWLASAFLAFRVLHGIFYIADSGRFRTLSWWAAQGMVIALFTLAYRAS